MASLFFFVIVPAFFYVLIVVVACWEKRLVWPYGPLEPQPRYGDPNGYGYKRVAEAIQMGFRCFGWSSDVRGGTYQVSYAFLLSPDSQFLAIVGTGTLLSTMNTTWLIARTTDDRIFYSTDHQNGVSIDLSGQDKSQLVSQATFPLLMHRETEWLQKLSVRTQPFDVGNEFECYHRLRTARTQRQLSQGIIAYTDATQVWWRYTFLGALRYAAISYGTGLLRAVTFGQLPKTA